VDQFKNAMPQGSSDDGEEEGLDWEKISGYGRFVSGALRRRWWLSGGIVVTGLVLTYLVYWSMPRTYHIETQLLAQKNNMTTGIVAGHNGDGNNPTRAAAETVLRRDNLVALLEKSELPKYWDEGVSNASRVKAWINAKLHRPPISDTDKMEMMVGTLESKLTVETKADWGGEGTVIIALDWSEPKMGLRLVNAAQQSFIETRHLTEISAISEAISILLGRATSMREEIDSIVHKIDSKTKEKGDRRRQAAELGDRERRPGATGTPGTSAAVTTPSDRETTQQLQALWEAKKAAIKDLEEMRRRRIAELQTRLAELRATYAESHPTIVDTTQTIESLSQESPQLAQLKKEEAALRNQYLGRASRMPEGTMGEPLTRPILRGSTSVRATAEPATGDDRETEFAKAQLRFTAEAYDHILERIEGAHMELEAARAAFKYRYIVVKPAQRPREPVKPKPAKVLGGGAAAALVLAVLAAVVADLRSGKVYERWQLERALRLPVLAEIRRDS
jgi:uncharacterized protein involved in exopolysaccharide biosynthesis